MMLSSQRGRHLAGFERRFQLLYLALAGGLLALGMVPGPARAEQADSAVSRTAAGALEAGFNHTCVVLTSGAVRCWGKGRYGQLGHDATANIGNRLGHSIKAAGNVPVGGKVTAVAAVESHTCALLTTGAVRYWGNPRYGKLGHHNSR